jgi:hypothetical protein
MYDGIVKRIVLVAGFVFYELMAEIVPAWLPRNKHERCANADTEEAETGV